MLGQAIWLTLVCALLLAHCLHRLREDRNTVSEAIAAVSCDA